MFFVLDRVFFGVLVFSSMFLVRVFVEILVETPRSLGARQ